MQQEEKYMTLEEVKEKLHNVIDIQQIRRYIKGFDGKGKELKPKLNAIKFGKRFLIKESDFENWLKEYASI